MGCRSRRGFRAKRGGADTPAVGDAATIVIADSDHGGRPTWMSSGSQVQMMTSAAGLLGALGPIHH
ncbi:hypothetical protein AYO39_01660 [Actinobacteria bacterium SCGC AG-212-D09]|nr:hypothetical protein AYO39_01660 [Actinobacteria bacterium SCGC AG-212-D09]